MTQLRPQALSLMRLPWIRVPVVHSTDRCAGGDERGHSLLLDTFEVDPDAYDPIGPEIFATAP